MLNENDDLSIIIVTYNNLKYTKECVNAIIKNTFNKFELIIIDNGSDEDTIKYIDSLDCNYILNNKNMYFAHAVNQGLELASNKYTVLINNDLIVYKNWDLHLLNTYNFLSKIYKVGAVGPLGRAIGGKQDYVTLYGEHGFLFPYTDNYDIFNLGNHEFRKNDYTETKLLCGGCLLINTELFKSFNGMDEQCVCVADDNDLSMRLRLDGYKLFICEDVFVYHYGHKTFELLESEELNKLIESSWKYFSDKWAYLNKDFNCMLMDSSKFYYDGLFNNKRGSSEIPKIKSKD